MAEPRYKKVRECGNCGVLANSNESQCQVCLGWTFRDRFQCESCGKLYPTASCEDCVQRHLESEPKPKPRRPVPRRQDEIEYEEAPHTYRRNVRARGRLAGPAIAMILISIVSLVYSCTCAPIWIFASSNNQNRKNVQEAEKPPNVAGHVVYLLVTVFLNVIVIIGSVQMKNANNYGIAVAAAIISVIPCCSPCYVLGIPFGIWALIVLMDSDVKEAFAS